jgi:methionine sulfoxide reductase heme-binding subunit
MVARLRQRLAAAVAALANWRFFKPAVFLACLAPGVWLGYHAWRFFVLGDFMALGVDPSITLLHETGKTSLIILLATLSITPLRRLLGVNRLQAIRRMLGVWAFTYAAIHVSLYLMLDQLCYSLATCEVKAIWEDVLKRRFIFVGALAFSILLALALTSTTGWMRRLGKKWQRLHRLVYVAAISAIIHFIWIQKSDIREPLNWAFWLAVLLGLRIVFAVQKRRRSRARVPVTA